jgi:hypothetical protein
MKKIILSLAVLCLAGVQVFAQFKVPSLKEGISKVAGVKGLSEGEIAAGLKEALTVGATNASSLLNQVDGFNGNQLIRIPFPEDVEVVATKLRQMGFGKKVDEFEVTLNRAAEQAAKEAAPIFVSAIKGMSITDAKNILTGADNAATVYLQSKTNQQLYDAFIPHVTTALNSTSATARWEELTTLYNKVPLVKKVDTDLGRYTTNKALNGLFTVVANEELKIRKDPAARVNDILKKVFG